MIRKPVRLADRPWDTARQELEVWIREATRELLRLVKTWDPTREDVETAVDTLDADKVPITRIVATTAPLGGGGNLGANRTLTLDQSGITHNNLGGRTAASAHPATAISNTPAGGISATEVQAALNELDTEKVNRALSFPSSMTVVAGTLTAGTVADVATLGGNLVHITEVAATPGFDVIFDFTSVPAEPSSVFTCAYYTGNASHHPLIELYDYVAAAWVPVYTLVDSGISPDMHTFPSWSRFVSAGAMRVRFYHAQAGNGTHNLWIDFVAARA